MTSPLEKIIQAAREHDKYVVAHPEEFTRQEVEAAALAIYQRERLSVAAILRYED